ncbi:MAG: 6-phospho-beta-glucosidase, partial [Chloroflexi bacterium]|nr:6-phospho-beta-glucosidase [Chloroflexota bacterium]
DFPPLLAATLGRVIASQELTVEAALTGSRPLFVEALLADGCVTDRAVAARLVDELLTAHKLHLPQFA